MKKKLLVLLLIFTIIGSFSMFVACKNSDSQTPNYETPNEEHVGNKGNTSNDENNTSSDSNTPNEEQGEIVSNPIFLTNHGKIVGITNYGKTQNEILIPSQIGEEKITSIGENAFSGCDILTSVEIPECIEDIHYSAFEGCRNLTLYFEGKDLPSGWNSLCWNIENNLFVPIVRDYINNIIADDGNIYFVDNHVRYALKNGEAVIVGWVGNNHAYIPNEIIFNNSQYKVMSIGDFAFYNCGLLASVDIPNNMEDICAKAFFNCNSLQTISIPCNLKSIGSEAFANCRSLKSVEFSSNSNLTNIGNGAFSYCNKLESIEIPNKVKSIDNNTFSNCSALRSIIFEKSSSLTGIYANAFYGCKSIERLDIPKSVSYIGNLAFAKCSALKILSFDEHSDLIDIDNGAFRECYSLFDLTIPASTMNIGTGAFAECNNITKATITTRALNSIPTNKLEEIIINGGGDGIEADAFSNYTALINIEIPAYFDNIDKNAFRGCNISCATIPASAICVIPKGNLKKVVINGGDGIGKDFEETGKYSEEDVFFECASLEEIIIKGEVSEIRSHAFYGCSNLTKVEIEMGVSSILENVFDGCNKLTTILLPASIGFVDKTAFDNCNSLRTIYCESTKTDSIHIEDAIISGRKIIWGYNNVITNNEYDYVLHDGQAYLTTYKGNNTNIVIPEYIDGNLVRWLGAAFSNNTNIRAVEIPESIIKIPDGAFFGCVNLTSVTFAENSKLTSIGIFAFGSYPFSGDGVMKLDNIVLPKTVTHIGSYAFAFSSLTNITIPKSVESIDANIFFCCMNLSTIYCETTNKPKGWNSAWNYIHDSKLPNVIWGYSGE
ncbi:MAG: leucine-rich repeat domain-containing protein [Clostridiales bacterium]|nr:leucine-rich repeat domain-containing protein [Clostridiales bacterium]